MNPPSRLSVDVLCVGHASHDLVFSIPEHPGSDEKIVADGLLSCGGGPAANAAVTVVRLGNTAAFVGHLGHDLYGEAHIAEFEAEGVETRWIIRSAMPTPLSAVLVKPDGQRALINYRGALAPLAADVLDFSGLDAKVMLFDGHEPNLLAQLLSLCRQRNIPTVVDAGSLHPGTEYLLSRVDYLACSEKFARQWLGEDDPARALHLLGTHSPAVVITLGERGLIWQKAGESGSLPAFTVEAVDTTGAGDAFHGAFAAALAQGQDWLATLRYASAAGAVCCTRLGARPGMPGAPEVTRLLETLA